MDLIEGFSMQPMCFCSSPDLLSLQVKRTTRPWCGSGSTRGSPSAAHPAGPTTSWWPTSCPTNLYHHTRLLSPLFYIELFILLLCP